MPKYENTPLSADYKDILRRREIARAMQERSFMPQESEMVSGRVIPNWGRGISNIGRAAVSSMGSKKAGEMEKALSDRYDTESAASMQRVMDTLQGRGNTSPAGPQQPIAPNPRKAALDATVDPYLRSNLSSQRVIDAMIKADAVKQGRGGSLPYQFLPTSKGIVRGNRREGTLELPEDPFMRATDDAVLQGEIAHRRQLGTGVAERVTDPATKAATTTAGLEAERAHELKVSRPMAQSNLSLQEEKADILNNSIDKAIENAGFFTTGLPSQLLGWAGGTPQHDLGQLLMSIKSNVGLDRLMELKKAGGGLGSVTEGEHKLLAADIASVEQSQSDDQLRENLRILKKHTNESWARVRAEYKKQYGKKMEGAPVSQSGPYDDEEKERRYQEWKASQ